MVREFAGVVAVGQGVSELRIAAGPGYRVYFCRHGQSVVVLLAGGSKRTQPRDIEKAKQLARALAEGGEPDGQDRD